MRWKEAAAAFGEAVEAAPYSRVSLFALANAQLALQDSSGLLCSAERLFGMGPMNEDVLGLLSRSIARRLPELKAGKPRHSRSGHQAKRIAGWC
jgi:hypothetical protein